MLPVHCDPLPGVIAPALPAPAFASASRPHGRCTHSTPSAPPRGEIDRVSEALNGDAMENVPLVGTAAVGGAGAPGRHRYRHVVALDRGDPLAPLRPDPATAGIFSDFDGTLSPIVRDPAVAEPVPGSLSSSRVRPALERRSSSGLVVCLRRCAVRDRPHGSGGLRVPALAGKAWIDAAWYVESAGGAIAGGAGGDQSGAAGEAVVFLRKHRTAVQNR